MAVGTTKHFVKKARKDIFEKDEDGNLTKNILVKKGESYWWWKFRYKERQVSITEPTNSDLDSGYRNEFDEKMEDFNSRKDDLTTIEEKEELVGEVEDFRDELQERLDNIPESLQESSIINERIPELEDLIEEINSIDIEDEE